MSTCTYSTNRVSQPTHAGLAFVQAIRSLYTVDKVPTVVLPFGGNRREAARCETTGDLIRSLLTARDGTAQPCILIDFSPYGARVVVEGGRWEVGQHVKLTAMLSDGDEHVCSGLVRSRFLDDFVGIMFIEDD